MVPMFSILTGVMVLSTEESSLDESSAICLGASPGNESSDVDVLALSIEKFESDSSSEDETLSDGCRRSKDGMLLMSLVFDEEASSISGGTKTGIEAEDVKLSLSMSS